MILYTVLSAKLLLSIAVTYPSSSLVEKKYQEVNNLAFLNKYVSESINKDDDFIISTVAELAFQTSLSNGGWVEIYKKDKTEIVKTFNIESSNLTKLDEMINISKNIKNYKNVFLIESIYESKDFINIASYNKFIKSLVIIPVYCFDNRIATITLFKNEEYKMEHDDVQVLSAFGDNIRMALENSNLMKESIEKEKYKNEMILAQKMQQKLLPQVLPIIENFSIAALSIPATVVGGDYYDTVFLKNGKLCIIIGDVSGKGISAAFYMAQLKGIVLAKSREVNTAKELLSGINEILYGTIESKMFITLAALVIDDIDGNLTLTRAGHMPFLIKNGENLDIITSSGIGVGLAKKSTFDRYLEEKPVKLNDKSAVIMFTDGINELNTYTNEEVGYKPLMELLTKNNVLDAQSYVSEMKSILNGYLEINANHDDMTVFALFFEKNNGTIIDNESLQNNYFITL